ncbi:MAG: hypothetical protein PT120_11985 [Aphanizomenon gracile PMC649.10]|nr:hypothetical protein [Aphanizomenon gracile PMC649.10]
MVIKFSCVTAYYIALMEKLTVKNFLNIKDIEFNLSKINIIIGQQASGKSILAN